MPLNIKMHCQYVLLHIFFIKVVLLKIICRRFNTFIAIGIILKQWHVNKQHQERMYYIFSCYDYSNYVFCSEIINRRNMWCFHGGECLDCGLWDSDAAVFSQVDTNVLAEHAALLVKVRVSGVRIFWTVFHVPVLWFWMNTIHFAFSV
jgi:hypothetical protein